MSLRFLEGFGGYATGAQAYGSEAPMLLQWSSWNSTPSLTSLSSGSQGNRKYLTCSGADPDMHMKLGGMDSTTVVIGCRIWMNGNMTTHHHLFRFEDGGSHLASLNLLLDGRLQVSTSSNQGILASYPTSEKAISGYTWAYVEAKIYFHASAGTVDFWINGTSVGSFTSLDTIYAGTSCDAIRMGNLGDTYWNDEIRITDIYVDDSTQRGPMDIWYQAADTAGSAANFTPSAGSNYQNVDDIGHDGDTTYNSSTATSTLDQIAHGDTLAVAPLALQPMVIARYVPTGSANIKVGLLSSTTHNQASAEGLSDTYDGYRGSIYVNDPATASPWASAAAADAAETTYEHAA